MVSMQNHGHTCMHLCIHTYLFLHTNEDNKVLVCWPMIDTKPILKQLLLSLFTGYVLCVVGAPDSNEHASRVPHYYNRSPGRASVQLLSSLV